MFESLKFYNYPIYLFTRCISLIGVSMQRIAFLWLVYSLTESATLVAIGVVSRQLAQVVLSPWAGLLADTLNRKNIIIVTQIIAVLVNVFAGILIIQNQHTIAILIASELLLGLVNGLEQPVRQSFINDIIPDKKVLGNAIALNSTIINFSQMIGPLIAGFLIASFGEGVCYLINSGMLLVFIAGMFMLKNIKQEGTKRIKRNEIIPDMVDGFKYAHKTLSVHYIMMVTIIASGFGFAFTVLLPIIADDLFNGEAITLGYMHTALSVGSFVSTLFVAGKKGVSGWHELTFISAIAYGATVLLLGMVVNLWWALLVLFVIGFAKAITFSSGKTALQIVANAVLQGRVSGLYFMYMMGAVTVGGFLIGLLADAIGYMPAIVIFAILNCVFCVYYWIKNSGVKRIYIYCKNSWNIFIGVLKFSFK